jgi:histidine triad (HIT) family protein
MSDPLNDCIFCRVASGDAESWKVYETDRAYAFLDIHPVSEYHTLVIPKRHYVNIFDVPIDELQHLMAVLKHVVDLYQSRTGLENVQIVNSSGTEAQQDVFHLHFHIVPRRKDDGQDFIWTTHLEMRDRFDEMLAVLK